MWAWLAVLLLACPTPGETDPSRPAAPSPPPEPPVTEPEPPAQESSVLIPLATHGGQVLRHGHGVTATAVSPDNRVLASGDRRGFVHLWDLDTGALIARLHHPLTQEDLETAWAERLGRELHDHERRKGKESRARGAAIAGLAFSTDGTRIVATDSLMGVSVWRVDDGEEVWRLPAGRVSGRRTVIAPGGTAVFFHSVSGGQRTDASVWTVGADAPTAVSQISPSWAGYSADGETLWTSERRKLVRRDPATLDALEELAPETWNHLVALAPDGDHGVVKGPERTLIASPLRGSGAGVELAPVRRVAEVRYAPSGARIAILAPRTITLVDAATGAAQLTLEGATSDLKSMAWSADGSRVVAGTHTGRVLRWDAVTGAGIDAPSPALSSVGAMVWLPDGDHLVVVADGELQVIDAISGDARCRTPATGVKALQVSSDGGRLMAQLAGSEGLQTWALPGCVPLARIPLVAIGHFAFSPDGATVSGMRMDLVDGHPSVELATWATADGRRQTVQRLPVGVPVRTPGALSPDGAQALLVQDSELLIHDVRTGALVREVPVQAAVAPSVKAWLQDGRTLLLAGVATPDLPTGDGSMGAALIGLLQQPLVAYDLDRDDIAWTGPPLLITDGETLSGDGELLIGRFAAQTLRLHDLREQSVVAQVDYPGGALPRRAAFSRDRSRVAVTTSSGELHVYGIALPRDG